MPDDDEDTRGGDTTRDGDAGTGGGGGDGGSGGGVAGDDTGGTGPPDTAGGGDGGGGVDDGGRDRRDGDRDSGYTPPSQGEWRNVLDALRAANAEAKKHRLLSGELRRQQEALQQERETEHEKALRKAAEDAAAGAEATWKPKIVQAAAKGALRDAGAVLADPTGKPLPGREQKMLRMLDLDTLDVADDGTVPGLAEQVQELKKEMPEFFERRVPPSRPKVDAADRQPAPAKKKPSAEQLAEILAGG